MATTQTTAPQTATQQAEAGNGAAASWFPSRYGAGDQAGALNEITPSKICEAVRLVGQGRVYDLAHVLHESIPAFPGRTFRQYLTTNYHHINRRGPGAGPGGLGRNNVNWIVEQVTATQQMGTHLDGLNHLQAVDRTYSGFRLADIVEDYGTNRLGIGTLPQIVTRGLLLDVAAARGGDRLGPGEVITVADAEAALAADGLAVRPGDAVLFHTGWGRLWGTENERSATGEPGAGLALAEWLAAHRVALIPVFFVTSGVRLDLAGLPHWPGSHCSCWPCWWPGACPRCSACVPTDPGQRWPSGCCRPPRCPSS